MIALILLALCITQVHGGVAGRVAKAVVDAVKSPKRTAVAGAKEVAKATAVERAIDGAKKGYDAVKQKAKNYMADRKAEQEAKQQFKNDMKESWDRATISSPSGSGQDNWNDPRNQNQHVKDHHKATGQGSFGGRPTAHGTHPGFSGRHHYSAAGGSGRGGHPGQA